MSSPGKYRGLRVDNREGVKGWKFQYRYSDKVYIVLNEYSAEELQNEPRLFNKFAWHEVIPETVGQSTGLNDKNGVEIYEGDGVRGRCSVQIVGIVEFVGIVEWNEQYAQFYIAGKDRDGDLIAPPFDIVVLAELEVIGNIHQNPELLEDKQ